jgi:hypothetical protein
VQNFVLMLFVVVVTFPFLTKAGLLPRQMDYLPEIFGAVTLVIVIALGVRDRFRNVRPAYWLVLGAIALNMLCGVLVNAVDPGPVFAGLRTYFRAIPLLLLPAVYAFSDKQVDQQLSLLLKLAILQLPIAAYQSLQPYVTGDSIYGTFMVSSILSMFLICAACVLTGAYLRGRITKGRYLLVLVLVLAPATFNETKGTLVLLPIALFATFLAGTASGKRLKHIVVATGLIAAFLAVFVPVYDYSQRDYERKYVGRERTLAEYFTEGGLERYLYGAAKGVGAESRQDVKRFDAVVVPLAYLAKDPVTLTFGLGIGNASDSVLGRAFTGHYYRTFEFFLLHSAARILLETGVLGLGLVLGLLALIFLDARRLAQRQLSGRPTEIVAVGWSGAVLVLALGIFYKDVVVSSAMSYLFWYLSGMVIADCMRSRKPSVG